MFESLLLDATSDIASWQTALLSMTVAYLLSQAIATVYVWTHRGVSYSRSLVVSLVVAGLVSSILMLAVGNNLARGLGIVGTLALIRFRTTMYDPLDLLFVFASFAAGVAAGTGNISTGLIGTVAFIVVVSVLQLTGFGSRNQHDGLLRVQVPTGGDAEKELTAALISHCRDFSTVTMREAAQGRALECVYQITLRDPDAAGRLIEAVTGVKGAHGVSVAMQEATNEI